MKYEIRICRETEVLQTADLIIESDSPPTESDLPQLCRYAAEHGRWDGVPLDDLEWKEISFEELSEPYESDKPADLVL